MPTPPRDDGNAAATAAAKDAGVKKPVAPQNKLAAPQSPSAPPQKKSTAPQGAKPKKRSPLFSLLVMLTLAGAGYVGWRQMQLEKRIAALEEKSNSGEWQNALEGIKGDIQNARARWEERAGELAENISRFAQPESDGEENAQRLSALEENLNAARNELESRLRALTDRLARAAPQGDGGEGGDYGEGAPAPSAALAVRAEDLAALELEVIDLRLRATGEPARAVASLQSWAQRYGGGFVREDIDRLQNTPSRAQLYAQLDALSASFAKPAAAAPPPPAEQKILRAAFSALNVARRPTEEQQQARTEMSNSVLEMRAALVSGNRAVYESALAALHAKWSASAEHFEKQTAGNIALKIDLLTDYGLPRHTLSPFAKDAEQQ